MKSKRKIIKLQKEKNRIKTRKMSLYKMLFMLCLIVLLIFVLTGPTFVIQTVHIQGNRNFSEEDIKTMLSINKKTNMLKFILDNYFYDDSNLTPYIDELNITIDFPNTLYINVNEREIVGYVPYLGTYLCIDKDGRVIDTENFLDRKIPIIAGLTFDGFQVGEELETADESLNKDVVELIRHLVKYELIDDIIKIDISNRENIKMYTTKIEILIGTADELNKKINIITQVIKDKGDERGILDVKDLKKPIVLKLT